MKNLLVITSALFATSTALAAPGENSTHEMLAIENALELTIGTALARGTGDLGGGLPAAADVAESGLGFDASIGWRITPNLLLGGYTTLTGFGDSEDASRGAVTASVGIKADWHFRPTTATDPWVSLGTGAKFMAYEDGDDERALTGVELARIQVGLDYRLGPTFAIAPVIGASATMYNHQYDDRMSDDAMAIDDKEINWTFSAGVMARFDTFATTR